VLYFAQLERELISKPDERKNQNQMSGREGFDYADDDDAACLEAVAQYEKSGATTKQESKRTIDVLQSNSSSSSSAEDAEQEQKHLSVKIQTGVVHLKQFLSPVQQNKLFEDILEWYVFLSIVVILLHIDLKTRHQFEDVQADSSAKRKLKLHKDNFPRCKESQGEATRLSLRLSCKFLFSLLLF